MPLDFIFPTQHDASAAPVSSETLVPLDGEACESHLASENPPERGKEEKNVGALSLAADLASVLESQIRAASTVRAESDQRNVTYFPPPSEAVDGWRGHFQELRQAAAGELYRTRHALENRLDEMAQTLHSDMRRLREECRSEWEINSSDVFRSATALSLIQDQIQRLEAGFMVLQEQMQTVASLLRPGMSQPTPCSTQSIESVLDHLPVSA